MQLIYAVTALAGLVAATSASPSSHSKRNYKFQVQNWEAGCARAGCYYNFNVTGKRDGEKPAFKAYCSGDDSGYFKACELLKGPVGTEVAAELAPYDFTTANGIAAMGVSLSFTTNAETPYVISQKQLWQSQANPSNRVTYNYTGHYNATFNQFAAPTYDFKVKPDEVTAVA
ncbi:hypothetical protein D0867_01913 [Hortaea werneckii]|uniref:Uncharacterized protein n=1 Tax=Hortaea werneckii TaxID=91943 RepID=A0A3M7A8B0_HORWE|nr:hypothetical protein D0867_01913 [Hortaea werneckii]